MSCTTLPSLLVILFLQIFTVHHVLISLLNTGWFQISHIENSYELFLQSPISHSHVQGQRIGVVISNKLQKTTKIVKQSLQKP